MAEAVREVVESEAAGRVGVAMAEAGRAVARRAVVVQVEGGQLLLCSSVERPRMRPATGTASFVGRCTGVAT